MELFSADFFSALAAIILIDLVLAGDNAIVIALAARNLPSDLQKRAIIWGTVGAVAVRSAMTVAVVWLLKVPGLLLAGGLLLVWIAYRLLVPREESGDGHGAAAGTTFWGAMRTIVVADAVMGLDNVLAVAGAAHGSFLLVVLGLLISIPIVVGGSRLILGFVNRYPVIIYLGAAVLAWTAAKMVSDEPLVKEFFAARPELKWALYALFVGGVLGFGLRSERRAKADRAWVPAAGAPAIPAGGAGPLSLEGGTGMKSILVPVDGSENAMNAVRHVISRHAEDRNLEVRLLHVRQPLTRHVARFVSRGDRQDYHRMRGEAAMARARALLDKWGVPYTTHVELGERAKVIGAFARSHGCQGIVMGVSRESPLLSWIKDSVPARVVERSEVPVELIAGQPVPALQRYGLPAGLGLALTLFAIAEE